MVSISTSKPWSVGSTIRPSVRICTCRPMAKPADQQVPVTFRGSSAPGSVPRFHTLAETEPSRNGARAGSCPFRVMSGPSLAEESTGLCAQPSANSLCSPTQPAPRLSLRLSSNPRCALAKPRPVLPWVGAVMHCVVICDYIPWHAYCRLFVAQRSRQLIHHKSLAAACTPAHGLCSYWPTEAMAGRSEPPGQSDLAESPSGVEDHLSDNYVAVGCRLRCRPCPPAQSSPQPSGKHVCRACPA